MDTLSNLKLQKMSGGQWQIARHLRTAILAGEMAAGSKLPSTQELAARWGTHVPTVHAALTTLVKEGLLSRRLGRGTFVRQRENRLTVIGIYYSKNIWRHPATAFQREIHAALTELLEQSGVELRTWIDPRPEEEQDQPWDELIRAVENRAVQAIIIPGTDRSHLGWQGKLPVPFAHLSSARIPNGVQFDGPQFVELSLRHLAGRGCRSVGLICASSPNGLAYDGGKPAYVELFERFVELSRELGLAIDNQWMRVPPREDSLLGVPMERFGYQEFHALWRQEKRSEGLVVYPDLVSRGTIIAMLEKGVRVPEELQVVLHKDLELEMICPLPVTYVTSSARAGAQALIEQVERQWRGEPCKLITLPFTLAAP